MEGAWRRILVVLVLIALGALAALEMLADRLPEEQPLTGIASRSIVPDTSWQEGLETTLRRTE